MAGRTRTSAVRHGLAYATLFLVLASPWLRVATHAAPTGHLMNPADERLVPWILGWVAHALATDPARVMDANINHPAPGQLTGIEHFLSTQILFAPVFWLTGNAVLGANVVAVLSYPLGALAMDRLLVALGCGGPAAWVGGLLFALGPLRVPGSLMLVKFPNLYLPLVALALTRLRDAPTLGRAAVLALVLTWAFLASYYLAVMVAVVFGVWSFFEVVRASPARPRFALLALAAGALAAAVLLLVSLPYLARPEASEASPPLTAAGLFAAGAALREHVGSTGRFPLVLAAVGALACLVPGTSAARAARRGLVMAVVGFLLMHEAVAIVQGHLVPMPYALLQASPARFFRLPARFVVIFGFGTAMLAAAALDVAWSKLGRLAGGGAIAAVVAGVLVSRGIHLGGPGFTELTGQSAPIYAAVADATRADPAPLLELPVVRPIVSAVTGGSGVGTEVESMLGSTRHWLPLVVGFSSFPPPHRRLIDAELQTLPEPKALDDVVDMTHMRWVLLQPESEWPGATRDVRAALARSDRLERVLADGGWMLLRARRRPQHPEWFAAIAAGARADRTMLGTPLAPLGDAGARGAVRATNVPRDWMASAPLFLPLVVANTGASTWPVAVPRGASARYTVRLVIRWRPLAAEDGHAERPPTTDAELLRDVPANESLAQPVWLMTPADPGPWELEVVLQQIDGARFEGGGNAPLRVPITITAAPHADGGATPTAERSGG